MSIVLFFGMTGAIVIAGFAYVTLVIHHHWKQSKIDKKQASKL